MAILFTPGQLMTALSLSKQQWRTYRQAFPLLNADAGRSACFSAGDLLATAVAQSASTALQMPVAALSPVAVALFSICNAHPWIRLERSSLALIPYDGQVHLLDTDQRPPLSRLALVVELEPLVAQLRERLVSSGSHPQQDLVFPPMIAGGRQ